MDDAFGRIHILEKKNRFFCGLYKRKYRCAVFPEHIIKVHHIKLWCLTCLKKAKIPGIEKENENVPEHR